MRANTAKALLRSGKPAVGTWLSLCSPMAARFLARTGLAWLNVDLEHSPADWETAASIFAAVADAGSIPLARVPAGNHDHIKRALDNGAYGVVVPMVMSREQAEQCVRACKYPPIGNRSVGGALHALNFGAAPTEYYARANDEILVVLQCEHIDAVRRAAEIYSVPGVDAVFVGPNDLQASMRSPDGAEAPLAEFDAALVDLLAACKKIGVPAGIHCFSVAQVRQRIDEGWQFLALGSDLSLMVQSTMQAVKELGLSATTDLANY